VLPDIVRRETYIFSDQRLWGNPCLPAMPSSHVHVVIIANAGFLDPDNYFRHGHKELGCYSQVPTLSYEVIMVHKLPHPLCPGFWYIGRSLSDAERAAQRLQWLLSRIDLRRIGSLVCIV